MQSLDVRVWSITPIKLANRTTYKVRWGVAGRTFSKTYASKQLAESRRSELLTAQRRGEAFDRDRGLPESEIRAMLASVSWYQNAIEFMDTVWPGLEPGSRRKLAESLATVTLALTEPGIDPVDHAFCFRWLVRWAFNSRERMTAALDGEAAFVVQWIADHSLPMSALADPKVARRAFNSTTTDCFGRPYAVNTYRNKKKGLNGAISFAIEMGRLDANPLERISTTPPKHKSSVDRTAVVNPAQARLLIERVREQGPTAPRLVAFFAVLYFAGLRPSEALALRVSDCDLPDVGWGSLRFAESVPYANAAWTDDGETSPRKSLKHRAQGQSRMVPACPELVRYLAAHIEKFGAAPDGRLFFRLDGGPIRHSTYAKIWARARAAALTPDQCRSQLGRRPYDLRHAAVSTWLNAGVPATQVAEWAGHSVEILLSTYAKCIDGPDQDELARRRIDAALGSADGAVDQGAARESQDRNRTQTAADDDPQRETVRHRLP
ncbi:integrase family protein [Catenulispora acidiphila DSM 44928]|uniref:Integrase family protein n=1 Tax=Catenulispora acidiphila (strain DSM 44928 / JCM 14897 / NBRC 102108 / NRRL B-24433 / ID139908) TaxID=479433 RepID=C7Q1Y1_CATAD|nr:tyrosine-type recombinase/integrase [Catenulispora acidiphila]ACU75682.1 integrase family protein [Catenulispora acidiphila DSM 44928]